MVCFSRLNKEGVQLSTQQPAAIHRTCKLATHTSFCIVRFRNAVLESPSRTIEIQRIAILHRMPIQAFKYYLQFAKPHLGT